MNQILYTGDEKNENKFKSPETKQKKQKKQKFNNNFNNYNNYNNKTVGTKKIVIFFSIAIILLGFCLIGGSIYAKRKIYQEVEATASPLVNIDRNDNNNSVEISVSHIRGIQQITYKWNEEEETILNESNRTNVTEVIDLIPGKNTLTVTVTEENGQTVTYEKEFSLGNIPTITLENVDNGVKIISYAEDIIDYITYSWDDGEETKIEVGEQDYEGIINAPKGRHTLKIVVVDQEGVPAEKTTTVIGATVPTITTKLGRKDGKLYFVINIEDEDQLSNVKITLNDEEIINNNITDKTYYVEVEVQEGENRLIIEAKNKNGLVTTDRKAYTQ